jgi:hypothetical protein
MARADHANITSPSRRRVLAGISVAVAPAVASVDKSLGAIALPDDPIFAAIKAHHHAVAHETACLEAEYRLAEALPENQMTWHFNDSDDEWTPPDGCTDAPEWIEVQQNISEAYDLRHDAIEALLTTEPTTLAGVVALLEYVGSPEYPWDRNACVPILFGVVDINDERVSDAAQAFPARLAATMRRLIAAA